MDQKSVLLEFKENLGHEKYMKQKLNLKLTNLTKHYPSGNLLVHKINVSQFPTFGRNPNTILAQNFQGILTAQKPRKYAQKSDRGKPIAEIADDEKS